MENVKINIGGREIPLRFKMPEFRDIEEAIGNLGQINELLMKGKNRIRNTITVIRICGNAGLKNAGEKADLTDDWLADNMDPYALAEYQNAVFRVMSRENASQAQQEENENKERDLVLEEIEAKKDPVKSHTGA